MIYIRADANSITGMGHLMRCLSLADAADQEVVFVLADETAKSMVQSRGYSAIILHSDYKNPESELPFWANTAPDFILVDSYYATSAYLSALRKKASLIYLDDLCAFPYPTDYLVNYNAYAQREDYVALYGTETVPTPKLLLGPTYAPLRSMFQNVPPRIQKKNVQNVLISTGGADLLRIALRIAETNPTDYQYHLLVGMMNPDREQIKETAGKHITVHENVTDMRNLFDGMDIAVSAAGSTLYELCACGIPLITYITADNQTRNAEFFHRLGLAENLGDLRIINDPAGRILDAVKTLSDDYPLRVETSRRMQQMIDGKGAARIWSDIRDLY